MERVIYRNTIGGEIDFSEGTPFSLQHKSGFDSVDNISHSQTNYGMDGENLISQQLSIRNLILSGFLIGVNKEDYLKIRRRMISVFNPKTAGTIIYVNEVGEYHIDVIPEFLPRFNEDALKDIARADSFTVTLKALDPYWTDKSEIDAEIPMAREENLFEFPLEITEEFEFSRLIAGDVIEIHNNGDVAVGAVFTINVNGILVNPRLYNVITQEYFALNGTFTTGTRLRISTVRGKKRVEQDDGDGWYNIMTKRKVESTFLQIERGINYLQLQADEGVEFTTSYIRFEPKILGV